MIEGGNVHLQDPPSIRAGLMTCPWIMYQDVEKFGGTSILRCCTVITPATALLFSGHSKLPTVQLIPLDAVTFRRKLSFEPVYDAVL